MKRAAFSKPIYPADAYREDYEMLTSLDSKAFKRGVEDTLALRPLREMLTGDGKTPAEDAKAGVTCAAYVMVLAIFTAVVLAGIAIAVVVDWMIFP